MCIVVIPPGVLRKAGRLAHGSNSRSGYHLDLEVASNANHSKRHMARGCRALIISQRSVPDRNRTGAITLFFPSAERIRYGPFPLEN